MGYDDADADSVNSKRSSVGSTASSRRRSYRQLGCILIGSALTFILVFIGLWRLATLDYGTMVEKGSDPVFDGRMISLTFNLLSVNAASGTAIFLWTIMWDTGCNADNIGNCTDVNIFADQNQMGLTTSNNPILSNNFPTTPFFIFNATAFYNFQYGDSNSDANYNWAGFRTNIAVDQGSTIQDYPFDYYTAEVFVFAQDMVTNETVGLQIVETSSTARGFHATALRNPGQLPGVIDEYPRITRTPVVKAYAIVIVAGTGIVTVLMFIASVQCAIFGKGVRLEVLALPVASLFALSSLRTTLPGAPATFDTLIDYRGILPILGLMAISAALTIGALVFADPTVDRDTWVTMGWDACIRWIHSRSSRSHRGHEQLLDEKEETEAMV